MTGAALIVDVGELSTVIVQLTLADPTEFGELEPLFVVDTEFVTTLPGCGSSQYEGVPWLHQIRTIIRSCDTRRAGILVEVEVRRFRRFTITRMAMPSVVYLVSAHDIEASDTKGRLS